MIRRVWTNGPVVKSVSASVVSRVLELHPRCLGREAATRSKENTERAHLVSESGKEGVTMDVEEKMKTLIRDLSPDSPEYKKYITGIVTQGMKFHQQAKVSRTLDSQLLNILKGI